MPGKRERALKPISEILGPLASSLGIQQRLLEEEVKKAWAQCLPEVWKENVFFRGFNRGVVLVSCSSSGWAQEVRLNSAELKKKVNALLKGEVVLGLKTTGLTKKG